MEKEFIFKVGLQSGYGSVVINSEKLINGIYSYGIVVNDKVIEIMKMKRVK